MSHYFNLIVNSVEDRLVELAVHGSRRIQSFPEFSGNSEYMASPWWHKSEQLLSKKAFSFSSWNCFWLWRQLVLFLQLAGKDLDQCF